jgi:radical SAM protein with 4Fe4S-binding SPASM domain
MISVSYLYTQVRTEGDILRYKEIHKPRDLCQIRPVVVWNMTQRCNLRCSHCYIDADALSNKEELSTSEAKRLLKDLALFKVPRILFSGGEPLLREDIFELGLFAKDLGLKTALSTNGVLITPEIGKRIKEVGFSYVGVSIDGMESTNDRFRGVKGAFLRALKGMRILKGLDIKVGLRLTLTRDNYKEISNIFYLIKEEGIDRVCFYHLVYSGRGRQLQDRDLDHAQTREIMDLILEETKELKGYQTEVLTVDNYVDGPYIYLKLLEEDPLKAEKVLKLLQWNGGGLCGSGVGIAAIGANGDVHPDQFWFHKSFGNIKEYPFSKIWMDTKDPLMAGLKDRARFIKGRCKRCCFFSACGGSLRVRSDILFNDPWAPDPACYLTDEEISLKLLSQI